MGSSLHDILSRLVNKVGSWLLVFLDSAGHTSGNLMPRILKRPDSVIASREYGFGIVAVAARPASCVGAFRFAPPQNLMSEGGKLSEPPLDVFCCV